MQLKHTFTRFVFPFSFKEEKLDTIVNYLDLKTAIHPIKTEKVIKLWEKIPEVDSCFLPHLKNILLEQDSSHYFHRRRLTNEIIEIVFRFGNQINYLNAVNKKINIDFKIQSIEVVLIRSGIGFVVIETNLSDKKSVNELIEFNYYTKYIQFNSISIRFCKSMINDLQIEAINRISEKWINWECFKQSKMGDLYSHPFVENEFSTKGVSFEEIFNWVQGLVFQKKEDYDNNQIANQTYLFTYLHTDPTDDLELKKELFSLRRAFKRSYIPSKEDILESSIEYVNTFNNIHFGVSLEGCCLWTIDTGEIFFDQFENRVKDRYFIMYLIGLHNRVALLNFRDQLDSSFPHIERQFEISNIDLKKVRKLRNKILSFYMKFHFTALTNITHIEKINSVMNQIMSADILIQEIKGKTNELDEYLMSNSDRKINKGISSLTIIGSILAPLSIVTSFFCISFYPYNGGAASNSYQIKSYIFAISTSVILSILLSLWLLRNKK